MRKKQKRKNGAVEKKLNENNREKNSEKNKEIMQTS